MNIENNKQILNSTETNFFLEKKMKKINFENKLLKLKIILLEREINKMKNKF